jgi:alpha-ribazole phosphatase/probable phosphoglycerate mutase
MIEQTTTLWLVRHGVPEGMEGRCYGRYDVGLSSEGLRQAESLATRIQKETITWICSSPLRRAVETARVFAKHRRLDVQTVDGFSEIHFGDLEGLPYEEIQTRFPAVFESWMTKPTETQFPNGESFEQMRTRVLGALDTVIQDHAGQSIAVITHSGVIRLLLAQALSIPYSEMFRLAQNYGGINRIDYSQHGAFVQLVNGVPS